MAQDKKHAEFTLNGQNLTIIVLSLFSAWLLAFPFEGRILYALLDYAQLSAQPFVLGAMAAHCAGLIFCGFFIKNMRQAKWLMLFSILFSIAASCVFFFPIIFLWEAALFSSSFLIGCCVAAWGFFLKNASQKGESVQIIASMLVFTYILTTLLSEAAAVVSPHLGLGLSILLLGAAFVFALRLPENDAGEAPPLYRQEEKPVSLAKSLGLLFLFILIAALNVGLMFHVQYPAFSHLGGLTGWFWAVPYIAAVLAVRKLPRKTNRAHVLYAAIAMTGFSFIAFILLDRSAASYLIVDTLMVGSFGILNLYWWSVLGEMLRFHRNPAIILGTGLSANVLGTLLGALIGNADVFGSGQGSNITLLSLGLVCVTIVILPPLHARLTVLFKSDAVLSAPPPITPQKQAAVGFHEENKLTEREREIASLLVTGKTYGMIARELCVSENTVKTHAKSIYAKAGVHNRTELVKYFLDSRSPPAGY